MLISMLSVFAREGRLQLSRLGVLSAETSQNSRVDGGVERKPRLALPVCNYQTDRFVPVVAAVLMDTTLSDLGVVTRRYWALVRHSSATYCRQEC